MQNQILTNRSIVKQDRISKILSNYKTEIDKHSQQSFRMLSQKIKRKVHTIGMIRQGNQISDNQAKYPIPKIKLRYPDSLVIILKANSKLVLRIYSYIKVKSKNYNQKPKDDKQMVPRINKIQNDIFKNYLAQRNCNGSKTYRDSRDLDVRIKMSDKSTHSQQALLQTLINKSYENKFNEPRDSPELCYASQHIFKLLQQSINGQSSLLLRSGSQGNVANTSSSNNKTADPKFNKIKTFLESTKTFHSNTDPYKLTTDQELLQAKSKFVKVNQSKIQSLLQIANKIKNTMDALNQILIKQEKHHLQYQISYLMNCHLEIVSSQSLLQNDYLHINIQLISLESFNSIKMFYFSGIIFVYKILSQNLLSSGQVFNLYGFAGQFNFRFNTCRGVNYYFYGKIICQGVAILLKVSM